MARPGPRATSWPLRQRPVPEIGIGFTPFPRCTEKPGHYALLGIHSSPARLVTQIVRIYRGRPMRRDYAIDVVAREMHIESDEPFAYIVDGDLYQGARDLTVAAGPQLQVIVP